MRYFEIEFGQKEDPRFRTGDYHAEEVIAIKADHWPTFEEAEEFNRDYMERHKVNGVHSITEISEAEVHSDFNDDNFDEWPVLTERKVSMKMKIKYEVVVDNMEEFAKAHSIVEELCHLYDGIDKEKCLTFANAAAYMLDIINGEQNDSKEKEV